MPSLALKALTRLLRARPYRPETSLEEMRQTFETMAGMLPAPRNVAREPVENGSLRGEWLLPPEAPADRAVLYLHGGAYVLGSLATHRGLAGRIARAAGVRLLSLEYRLAPEHPFPAAIEDAMAAY